MCEKCNENINNKVESIKEIELSEEQLQEIQGIIDNTDEDKKVVDSEEAIYYFDPLALNTDNLAENIEFDKEEFDRGIKAASYVAGFYTALINAGMSNIDSSTLILTEKQIELSTKIAEINSNATIEASKNQQIMIEKNSL